MTEAVDWAPRLSMEAAQTEIVHEMSGLHDALARYEYLVGLGRDLMVPGDCVRLDEHSVAGCQSRVWIRAELRGGCLHIAADSDAMITRGIIALLQRVLDGRTPGEILRTELFFLDQTGLSMHLSPSRANGLAAMVRRIRAYAEDASGLA